MTETKECEHFWKMFNLKEAVRSGYTTYYCQKCLKVCKVKLESWNKIIESGGKE